MFSKKGFILIRTRLRQNLVNDQQGFTLIEILITMSILSVLFALGYAGFRDFSRRQQLQVLSRQLQGDLRQAQEEALAGIKPSIAVCNSPNVLNSYGFFAAAGGASYTIYVACSGGATSTVLTRTMPTGFTIIRTYSPPGTVVATQFKALGQGTTLPAGENAIITITDTVTSNTSVVTMTDTGEIK